MTRHLVGLIDGTMVSASRASTYGSYSNVFELACLLQLRDRSEDGGPQICFYTSGISSQPDTSSIVNLITGNSIKSQIIDQYTNICSNYDFEAAAAGRPDKIYLFGFSRGAMAVRALASLIAEFGLLHPRDIRDLPIVLDAWDRSIGKGNLDGNVKVHNAHVEFVGLFDSVMGGSERLKMFNPIRFKNLKLPARCRKGIQILAIDENRPYFKPKYWDGIAERTKDPAFQASRILRQIWMPGVHSDVGGTGNPIWGQAAFLAMTYFIDKHTDLALDRSVIAQKEAALCEAVADRTFFIRPHRRFGRPYERKPIGHETAHERHHPICTAIQELTYAGRDNFRWQDHVFGSRFKETKGDEELNAYFEAVLKSCLEDVTA